MGCCGMWSGGKVDGWCWRWSWASSIVSGVARFAYPVIWYFPALNNTRTLFCVVGPFVTKGTTDSTQFSGARFMAGLAGVVWGLFWRVWRRW